MNLRTIGSVVIFVVVVYVVLTASSISLQAEIGADAQKIGIQLQK